MAEAGPGIAEPAPDEGPDLAAAVARAVARDVGVTPARVVILGPGRLPRTETGKVRDAAIQAIIDRPDDDHRGRR